MSFRYFPWKRVFIFGVELFFGLNVILLDTWVFLQTHNTPPNLAFSVQTPTPSPTPPPIPQVALITPSITPQPTLVIQPGVKDYFVTFGSGQSQASDWTDVPGLQVYINSANYPSNAKIVFEASVEIPNGNQSAQIRLFEKTDGHMVWSSDMSFQGSGVQLVTSQPLTLDPGNKLYTVQMKTQLPALTYLYSARLHITLP